MKIDELEIKEILGKGAGGVVYLVYDKYTDKEYALKIMKYTQKSVGIYLSGEIEFNKKVVKKYPNFFIQLKDYEISEDCSLYQRTYYNLEYFLKNDIDFRNRYYSKQCISKIYTLVDGQLVDIFDSLSKESQISTSIQFLYILYIMMKEKKVQGDINDGNIGYLKTAKKYVNLKVKNKIYRLYTYGYLVQLLDTDFILDISEDKTPEITSYFNPDYCYQYFDTINVNYDSLTFENTDNILKEVILKTYNKL